MDIIHAMNKITFPRCMTTTLAQRLGAMPAVVVTGARQTGKSTLVRMQPSESRPFYSLDDIDVLDLARQNPEALREGAANVTLDESRWLLRQFGNRLLPCLPKGGASGAKGQMGEPPARRN